MSTQTSFDVTGLSRAIQGRDRRYHLALYADDAQVEIIDSAQPEAPLQVLYGKAAIGEWLDGMSSAAVQHEVMDAAAHPEWVTYTEKCHYADGREALFLCTAQVRRGQISHAVVTLRHLPGDQPLSQPSEPTATRGPDHQQRPILSHQDFPGEAAGRHLPGNFLG